MVARNFSAKKTFLKISQNSQINTCLSNTVECLQAVMLATLLKNDPALVFQKKPFIDPLQNRCSWIIHKIHRKTPVLEPSLIKFQVLCTASLLKRDSNTSFFLWILTVIQEHLWTADSETLARLFKNTFFYRTFPVTDSHIFRFPACNFIKKETPV